MADASSKAQYAAFQQSSYDGGSSSVDQHQSRSSNDEMNSRVEPMDTDDNQSSSAMPMPETGQQDDALERTDNYPPVMIQEPPASTNPIASSLPLSSFGGTSPDPSNLNKRDRCPSASSIDSADKYQQMMSSQNNDDPTKTLSKFSSSSSYRADGDNDSSKYSPLSVEKNSIPEPILKQDDPSSLRWECEVCTYENDSTEKSCWTCKEGQRPYAITQMISQNSFPSSAQPESPISKSNLYPPLSERRQTTQNENMVSPYEHKPSASSIIASKDDENLLVYIIDLPFDKSDLNLEQMIKSHLKNNYQIDITEIKCYSDIGVGIIYVTNKKEKKYLVKNLRFFVLDPHPNKKVRIVEQLQPISYLVANENMKIILTPDEIAQHWQQISKSSQLPICEIVAAQFTNIFKIIAYSLDELIVLRRRNIFKIKDQLIRIYLNADCSFFQDLPQNLTSSQILSAINTQIGEHLDENAIYVQYNRDVSNVIVLTTNLAHKWSTTNVLSLNHLYYMKKQRLPFRLVLPSVPNDISTNIIIQDKFFENSIIHNTRIGNKLIIEVSDKSVYDRCISTGKLHIQGRTLSIEPFTKIIRDSENVEINDETWYETEMLDYHPDIKQFLDNPEHVIFKYKWNSQKWLEQFQRYEGINNKESDKIRRLLRVTVMLNTISVLRKKSYSIEVRNREKEIKLNLEKMTNFIYTHRSKLIDKQEILTSIRPPYPSTTVEVINEDCLIVYEKVASDRNTRPLLLNMANAQTPGGGYRKGAGAQEENLFRRSNYYLSLDMELDQNKQADRFWCTADGQLKPIEDNARIYPFDEYGAIYTSDITVFRDTEDKGYAYLEQPLYRVCSIASAAYARPDLSKTDPNMLTEKYAVNTRKKIENIFAIAYHHKHDILVLSAYGCGAFRNPPTHIAMIFKSVIEQYAGYFQRIYFSIIDDHNTGNQINPNGNYQPFKNTLHGLTVRPSTHKLDINMMSGPFKILDKNHGKLIIDHVKIFDLHPCRYGSLCKNLTDTQHCQSYSHPPLCPQCESCDINLQDDVHISSFLHRMKCLDGGLCRFIDDEKHLYLYDHPKYCSDQGFCTNMDKDHLKEFRHVDLCKDNLKCLDHLKGNRDHCRIYRHCQRICSYGSYCINFHDQEHLHAEIHPFRKPCPLTPFACLYHMDYLQLKKDTSSRTGRDIEEHCSRYSHVCPFGRQCNNKSDSHLQTSIHIARNLCPNLPNCNQLSNEEHLNSYTHPNINDIRYVCVDSKNECLDRANRDHIIRYRHLNSRNTMCVIRYTGLNKNINFVRNQDQLLKRLRHYTEKENWKRPKDTQDDILSWIRSLQPIYRCNKSIFQSILIHSHVMSKKYIERLSQATFVANAVEQHPNVRKISNQHASIVLQDYIRDFIRALVAIEFDKKVSSSPSPSRPKSSSATSILPSPIKNDQLDMLRMKESQMKSSLSNEEIDSIKKHAIAIANISLKLHSKSKEKEPMSDELFDTNDHVLGTLGPNLGYYSGDIFIVFKHEIMFHPDSNFSIQSATSFGRSGDAYKQRPWLKDPGTSQERIECYHSNKLHCSILDYDYAAAMELMALTGIKKKSMDVTLKDVQQRWMSVDAHEVFESHLPHLIPLDYIEQIYIPKNLFNSLSTDIQILAKNLFAHDLIITEHDVDLHIKQELDRTRIPYEKYVQNEIVKKIEQNNYRFNRGTIIRLPGTAFRQYVCLPITISQSFYQFNTIKEENDILFIYWQALGGDMMFTISEYRIDSSRDQSHNLSLLCYIADIPPDNTNVNDYRESYSYITNHHPYSHRTLVITNDYKAKSNQFHRGCNIYDYIGYCLKIQRSTGEVTLRHVGSNSIYNHQTIKYTFKRSEIDLNKLEYIYLSAHNKNVSIRNLVLRHEPIQEYYPSFDKNYKENKRPPSPAPRSSIINNNNAVAGASALHFKHNQKDEKRSHRTDVQNKSLAPCPESVNCLRQYSSEHSQSHNKMYSHPCRFSELCRAKSDHPHLEHIPRSVPKCRYDKDCRNLIDPIHRAKYRHTDLPDFLIPCRHQKTCRDTNIEHRIKYSHGERIPFT